MIDTMKTIQKPANLFVAAASAVDQRIALGNSVIEVRPLVDGLTKYFPRHQPQELSAAVITAIALRGAAMQWQAKQPAPATAQNA